MTVEDEGGHSTLYVPVVTLWSRVRRVANRQGTRADGRAAIVTHSVVTRYRNDVKAGDRFLYRGRNLEVISAADVSGGRAYLGCLCAETAVSG
jgi:SPP1 family predicted phage head-tail adaptor